MGSTYRAKKEAARHACEAGNGTKIIGPIRSHPDRQTDRRAPSRILQGHIRRKRGLKWARWMRIYAAKKESDTMTDCIYFDAYI